MTGYQPPARTPCPSCPYRRDVPSGLWHPDEYAKLSAYDRETFDQPTQVFLCHQQNGRVCGGWAGCHDMDASLSVRLAVARGDLSPEAQGVLLDYVSPVELHGSGAEAAAHGLRDVAAPGVEARVAIERLEAKAARRHNEA